MTAQLLTVRQAAERLATSRATAYRLIRAGALDVVYVESMMRVPTSAVDAYVDRLIARALDLRGPAR